MSFDDKEYYPYDDCPICYYSIPFSDECCFPSCFGRMPAIKDHNGVRICHDFMLAKNVE